MRIRGERSNSSWGFYQDCGSYAIDFPAIGIAAERTLALECLRWKTLEPMRHLPMIAMLISQNRGSRMTRRIRHTDHFHHYFCIALFAVMIAVLQCAFAQTSVTDPPTGFPTGF